MPLRLPHPCASPGCPALVRDGARCPDHTRARLAAADSFRPSAAMRGYDSRWRAIRLSHLKREPLCRFCAAKGLTVAASQVDHIVPLSTGGTHADSNLRSLCGPCHSTRTATETGYGRRSPA